MQTELQRTNENFTTGLVNLPIVLENNKPVKHYDSKTGREKYDVVPDMRYPLFEIDSDKGYKIIHNAYEELRLPVYVHKTMRGYHFISLVALHKDCYSQWIKPLMKYNPKCPMVTLRIRPNKWVDEYRIFFNGAIHTNGAGDMAISQLEEFKGLFEKCNYNALREKYYIVNYRMTGELGNL